MFFLQKQFFQEGCWKRNLKYIEQNCFIYFLRLRCTDTGQLAVVALSVGQEVMTVSGQLNIEKRDKVVFSLCI